MGQKRAHTMRGHRLAHLAIKKKMEGDERAAEAFSHAALCASAKFNAKALNTLIQLLEEEHDNREKRLG